MAIQKWKTVLTLPIYFEVEVPDAIERHFSDAAELLVQEYFRKAEKYLDYSGGGRYTLSKLKSDNAVKKERDCEPPSSEEAENV